VPAVLEPSLADGVTRMRTHWSTRPQWAGGARYAWHLTFEDCVDLHRTAATVQAALRSASHLDTVPIERLHLTLADVGATADVSLVRVRRHAEDVFVRSGTVAARALVLQRVTVAAEGVMLEAPAHPWLDVLAQLLTGTTSGGHVWPHVSLAYSHADGDPEAVLELVRKVVTAAPTVTRPRLTLMELRREGRSYECEVIAQQSLTCA
jgi:2'-5' RNA ligase